MYNFSWRYRITCDQYYDTPAMREILANPDLAFLPGQSLIKNDIKTTVATMMIDGHRMVIKRYNIVNRWHAFMRYWVSSRASVCWKAAHSLLKLEIPTPQPIAIIEKRLGFLRSVSYYIHEFIPGMLAKDYFEAPQKSESWAIVATQMVELFEKLEKHKIIHGDLKVTNIIISNQKPLLIDLDDTRHYHLRFTVRKKMKKDIARFMNYWKTNPFIYELFATLLKMKNTF